MIQKNGPVSRVKHMCPNIIGRCVTWVPLCANNKAIKTKKMAMKYYFILIILTPLLLTQSLAADSDTDSDAYERGDFDPDSDAYVRGDDDAALREWLPLAEQGHAQAQYLIGVMYDNGRGVSQDYRTAVKWYRLAAEQGHAGAQFNLGVMYYKGRGVTRDYETAMKWTSRAAEKGLAKAQYNLGVMYIWKGGLRRNLVPAHMWINIAAASDNLSDDEDALKARNALKILTDTMRPRQLRRAI